MRIDKSRLALHFGKRALSYDRATPVQHQMARQLVAGVLDRLGGRRPGNILELGCGAGRMTGELTRHFPEARVTALDIAPEMVARARGLVPRAEFVVADAEAYVAEARTNYDLIISNAAAQWFVDARVTLASARALLAPGGQLAVATFGADTFRELDDAFRHAYERAALPVGDHLIRLPSAEAWGECLPDAELVETHQQCVFPDVRAFLRSIQEAGATNAQDGRHVLSRTILRDMTNWYAWHHAAPSGEGIVATYHIIMLYLKARGG